MIMHIYSSMFSNTHEVHNEKLQFAVMVDTEEVMFQELDSKKHV